MASFDYTSKDNDYMTPKSLIEPLLDFMGITEFDTDIASSNMNIPAKKYRTPDGEFLAEEFDPMFKVSEKDGLAGDFGTGIHFCNPPFRRTREFIRVISQEVAKEPSSRFWCILPSDRFETKYYKEYILKNPNCFMVFLPKAGFLKTGQPLENPIPSVKVMYCYFGQDAKTTAESFNELYGDYWAVVYNGLA